MPPCAARAPESLPGRAAEPQLSAHTFDMVKDCGQRLPGLAFSLFCLRDFKNKNSWFRPCRRRAAAAFPHGPGPLRSGPTESASTPAAVCAGRAAGPPRICGRAASEQGPVEVVRVCRLDRLRPGPRNVIVVVVGGAGGERPAAGCDIIDGVCCRRGNRRGTGWSDAVRGEGLRAGGEAGWFRTLGIGRARVVRSVECRLAFQCRDGPSFVPSDVRLI